MRVRNRGFTVIEIMAVLAIIAILALMTLPSFLDRIIKQQIEASLPLADIAKPPIAAMWARQREFPADNAAAGLPVADKIVSNYVRAVTVTDGAIHITFGNRVNGRIDGKTLSLRPAVVEDEPIVPIAWICGGAEVPNKMTVRGQDKTDIEPLYLPLSCRALKKS